MNSKKRITYFKNRIVRYSQPVCVWSLVSAPKRSISTPCGPGAHLPVRNRIDDKVTGMHIRRALERRTAFRQTFRSSTRGRVPGKRNRLAETRAPRIRWIWYRGRAMPRLPALTVTEKHVIVLKSSEMTVGAGFDVDLKTCLF